MSAPLIMIVFMGLMLFMMTRTQKKQQKERQNLLDSIETGASIVTIGGLHGVVAKVNVEKGTVLLDCEGIFLEFERSAVRTVTSTGEVAPEVDESSDATDVTEASETTDEASETETTEEDE